MLSMLFPQLYPYMSRRYGQTPGISGQPSYFDQMSSAGPASPGADDDNDREPWWRTLGVPKQYAGQDVDPEDGRSARAAGLGALGQSLLAGASSGDYGGAIARGFQGFTEARTGALERTRRADFEEAEEARRQEEARRAAAQEADRDRQADQNFDRGALEMTAYKEAQERGRNLRAATGKSAEQMVAEIQATAASNPDDETLQRMAKRAVGYSLGEDSDLNSLAKLHDDMTQRAGRDADVDWKTQQEIEATKKRVEAGVEEDPLAAGRRAERSIRIQEAYAARPPASSSSDRQTNTEYDDLQREIDKIVDVQVRQRTSGPLAGLEKPMTMEEIQALRDRALPIALENLRKRRSALERGSSSALDNQILDYDPATGTFTPR